MDMATWPVQQSASWAMALPPLALAAVISPHSGEDIISAVPADADTDTDTSGPVTPQMEQHSLHFFSQQCPVRESRGTRAPSLRRRLADVAARIGALMKCLSLSLRKMLGQVKKFYNFSSKLFNSCTEYYGLKKQKLN
ncbi:hypothetical protein TYRP_012577 [Tyrophagus putrescentiae]|nr:hypothetical protein TYRP_012577 [Tyrophagus putrescentiae]